MRGRIEGRSRRRWLPATVTGLGALVGALLAQSTNIDSILFSSDWARKHVVWVWGTTTVLAIVAILLAIAARQIGLRERSHSAAATVEATDSPTYPVVATVTAMDWSTRIADNSGTLVNVVGPGSTVTVGTSGTDSEAIGSGGHAPEPNVRARQSKICGTRASLALDAVTLDEVPLARKRFDGRKIELDKLHGHRDAAMIHGESVVILVSGPAGVGKTALAIYWAKFLVDGYPDGIRYIDLRGFDHTNEPAVADDAMYAILASLLPQDHIPPDENARAHTYRSLLTERKMFLICDNARDAGQVRPLLPGGLSSGILITSRNRLTGIARKEGARPLIVGGFLLADAEAMLARMLGMERLAAEPASVGEEILELCARLPMALEVVGATAQTYPRLKLSEIVKQLRDEQGRHDFMESSDAESGVWSVFSWSYQTLDPKDQRTFRMLGLTRSTDIDVFAAASLLGAPKQEVQDSLQALSEINLIERTASDRYEFHDLLRAYAVKLSKSNEVETADQRSTLKRLFDFYLQTALVAARCIDPHGETMPLVQTSPGVQPREISSYSEAMEWFAAERSALLSAIAQAAEQRFDIHVYQLAWAMNDFLHRSGYWRDIVITQDSAINAAKRLDDVLAEARATRLAGRADARLGNFPKAAQYIDKTLRMSEDVQDHAQQGHAHLAFGLIAELQGHHAEAVRKARRALEFFERANYLPGQARALNGLAWNHAKLNQRDLAIRYGTRGLALHQHLKNSHGEADTLDTIGHVQYSGGEIKESIESLTKARDLFRKLKDRWNEATTQLSLGKAYRSLGDLDVARRELEGSYAIFKDLDHPGAVEVENELLSLNEETAQTSDKPRQAD